MALARHCRPNGGISRSSGAVDFSLSMLSRFVVRTSVEMKRFTSVLVVLLIASVAAVFFLIQQDKMRQARAENESLKQGMAQLDALRDENARLNKGFVDQAELARLRGEHSELMRLRSEVALLRRERTQSQR